MRAAVDALLSIVFAARCAACDDPLDSPTAGPVCGACWQAIHPLTPPLCPTCGDALATWRTHEPATSHCTACRTLGTPLDLVRAAGAYEGPLRAVVHALKYDGCRSLAAPLARLMRDRGNDVLAGADVIVPVPLHWSRQCSRGFNQSVDLARQIGLPIIRALRRSRATRPQTMLPAAERHINIHGAFSARRIARQVHGRIVVLIDDVSTTGATLAECATVLRGCGAKEVRALIAARAVIDPLRHSRSNH